MTCNVNVGQDTGIKWEALSNGLVICCLGFQPPVRPFRTWSQVSCSFPVHCQARMFVDGHDRAIAFAKALVFVKHKCICKLRGIVRSIDHSTLQSQLYTYSKLTSHLVCIYRSLNITSHNRGVASAEALLLVVKAQG